MFNFGSYFSYDSLTIYDGGSMSSDLVGKFCGNSLPPDQILSSSNDIMMRFKTVFTGIYDGFHVEYSSLCKSHRFIIFVTNKSIMYFF